MLAVHKTSFSKEIITREGVRCIEHPLDSIKFVVEPEQLNGMRYIREAIFDSYNRRDKLPFTKRNSKRILIAYQPITKKLEQIHYPLGIMRYSGLYWYLNDTDYPYNEDSNYSVKSCPIEGVAACWLKQGISMPYFDWVNRK